MPIDVEALRQRVKDVTSGDHLEVYEIEELIEEIEQLRAQVAQLTHDLAYSVEFEENQAIQAGVQKDVPPPPEPPPAPNRPWPWMLG